MVVILRRRQPGVESKSWLAEKGHLNGKGKVYDPRAIKSDERLTKPSTKTAMAEALQKWSGALQAILAGETIADYMQPTQPDNVVKLPVSA
jgi:hypothetical protein